MTFTHHVPFEDTEDTSQCYNFQTLLSALIYQHPISLLTMIMAAVIVQSSRHSTCRHLFNSQNKLIL